MEGAVAFEISSEGVQQDINQYLVRTLDIKDNSGGKRISRYFPGAGEIILYRPTEESLGIIVIEGVEDRIVTELEKIANGENN